MYPDVSIVSTRKGGIQRMAKKKPKRDLKDIDIEFKCTAEERDGYQLAADTADESRSQWIRKVLNAELKRTGVKG